MGAHLTTECVERTNSAAALDSLRYNMLLVWTNA